MQFLPDKKYLKILVILNSFMSNLFSLFFIKQIETNYKKMYDIRQIFFIMCKKNICLMHNYAVIILLKPANKHFRANIFRSIPSQTIFVCTAARHSVFAKLSRYLFSRRISVAGFFMRYIFFSDFIFLSYIFSAFSGEYVYTLFTHGQ
jgi:hypothetical protein